MLGPTELVIFCIYIHHSNCSVWSPKFSWYIPLLATQSMLQSHFFRIFELHQSAFGGIKHKIQLSVAQKNPEFGAQVLGGASSPGKLWWPVTATWQPEEEKAGGSQKKTKVIGSGSWNANNIQKRKKYIWNLEHVFFGLPDWYTTEQHIPLL